MIKAVIFDMDGVIVDTEPLSQQRVFQYIKQYNPALIEKDVGILIGRGAKEVWSMIAKLAGVGLSAQAMKEEYILNWLPLNGGKIDYLKHFRPSVKEVLDFAKAHNLKTAVASSTEYQKVKAILTEVGIFSDLDEVISGENCPSPKPKPDIYFETANRLNVLPQECLVIEDSTVGIEAAHRAGTIVAALIDDRFLFDRSKADIEIISIADVIPILLKNQENGDNELSDL